MFKRGAGILLHITSLPSPHGIGDFGPAAYRFADFLEKSSHRYWQLLPLNPTDSIYHNSPYSSKSAFAVNPLLISPEALMRDGFLPAADAPAAPFAGSSFVDYFSVEKYKKDVLHAAFRASERHLAMNTAYADFCSRNAYWLEDYALFIVLKNKFNGQEWCYWPEELRRRDARALSLARKQHARDIEEIRFIQFAAYRQWEALRAYCRRKRIDLIGDIPIYVNYDSADVWSHPHIFKLNEAGMPVVVAGVPPDYFSETGQRWGNPVYDWEALQKSGYAWWYKRFEHNLELFDRVRVDHFRGFVACWEIPSEDKTAVNGEWVEAPAEDFFKKLCARFRRLPIIAEDLGIITPDVTEIMETFGFPGMKVLLFAFGGDLETNPYLPENYDEECVVYTGTHDNNTIKGWFLQDASEKEKESLDEYFGKPMTEENLPQELIYLAFQSPAWIAIIPLQDHLELGAEARMNKPATLNKNWSWRLDERLLTPALQESLSRLVAASQRQ